MKQWIYFILSAVLIVGFWVSAFSLKNKTSGFAEAIGSKIYYETAGKGKPIVFVHGGLVDSRLWD